LFAAHGISALILFSPLKPTEMFLLDRYLFRNFLEPLLLSLGAFLGIWLIFDLSDHGSDFLRMGTPLWGVAQFYLLQLPQILLLALPIAILLALLFCCGRMSRNNEIISMLAVGRSLGRVLAPLFGAGLVLTGLCLVMNYELAPRAEAYKRAAIDGLRKTRSSDAPRDQVDAHLFRDRLSRRTWFVRRLRPTSSVLEGVQILLQDENGNIIRKWYAAKAIHDPATRRWTLQRGMIVDLNPEGEVLKIDNFEEQGQRSFDGWLETPWRIASSRLDPQQLTTPELGEYLINNHDFSDFQLAPFRTVLQDRWALPWTCVLVILTAAPLGIVFSRRGSIQGAGLAILLFFLLLVSRSLFLALGKAGRLSPELAAWGPLAFFFAIGLCLFWMRSANRDFSSLFLRKL
jgi:lipopolysaccharide export system permease protein